MSLAIGDVLDVVTNMTASLVVALFTTEQEMTFVEFIVLGAIVLKTVLVHSVLM